MSEQFEIVILGGGPGGYSAALRAAQLGVRTAVVEKAALGGLCLHDACIPSKSLIAASASLSATKTAEKMGIEFGTPKIDWEAVQEHKSSIVDKLEKGLTGLVKSRDITLVTGDGRISSDNQLTVQAESGGQELEFKSLVIATGSEPVEPSGDIKGWLGDAELLDTSAALSMSEIPESLLVVGSDQWACEIAALYNSFGSKVTLAVDEASFLVGVESDIATLYKRGLTKSGVNIIEQDKGLGEVKADKNVISVGRKARVSGIGLEDLSSKMDLDEDGSIRVDENMQSSAQGIYAVGDVTGEPMLAHVAFAEGMVAAEVIAGLSPRPLDKRFVPRLIYGDLELASVGLTEEQAKNEGMEVASARYPLQGSGRALMLGESAGAVKVITDGSGTVIGLHMVGPRVTELAGEAQLLTNWEAAVDDLEGLLHPHPTVSESIVEAAFSAAGRPFHMMQQPKGAGR